MGPLGLVSSILLTAMGPWAGHLTSVTSLSSSLKWGHAGASLSVLRIQREHGGRALHRGTYKGPMTVAVSFIHSFIHYFLLSPCLGEEAVPALCSWVSDFQLRGTLSCLAEREFPRSPTCSVTGATPPCSQHDPNLPSPPAHVPPSCSVCPLPAHFPDLFLPGVVTQPFVPPAKRKTEKLIPN